jgi:hypothetical protein
VRGDPMPHIEEMPFHTSLLEWNVDELDDLEELHKQLSVHVRLLMETMRGEGAD